MKVSNPLTIIAIFAGVAETLATVSLIKLPKELQQVFLYFVMAFPSAIVILFFLVLYFKNNVLYAPGDFTNPEDYMKINGSKVKQLLNSETSKIESEMTQRGSSIEATLGVTTPSSEVHDAVNLAKTVIEDLFQPALELLVFQILEKPISKREEIIKSIESKPLKDMLFSIHEKLLKLESK